MKIALLLLVFGIYTSVIGLESKNEDAEKIFMNQLNEKGFDFDKNSQSCRIYKHDLPFAMCQDFLDFLKTSKQTIVNSQNQGEFRHHATFLNGERVLKNNATFILSESAGIEYRQIDFKNLPNVNNKADFKDYLEKLWDEKEINSKLSTAKVVLNLNNLNFLNEEKSQVLIDFIKNEIEKLNSQVADNLLLFGTSLKNSEISQTLSKLFKNNYTLSKSEQDYLINNSKIVFNGKNCSIDGMSYPNIICDEAIGFLAAINEYKKNGPHPKKDGAIIGNHKNMINSGTYPILLYGEPGNGKSTISKVFAKIFDAQLIELNYESAFGSDYDETKKNILSHFNRAEELILRGEKVIFSINKIESIGRNLFEKYPEDKIYISNLLKSCIQQTNKLPSNDQFIMIATTDKKDELDANLVSRLGFRVEIKKPSNEEIVKKINKIFDDKNIKIDQKDLLRAIKLSKNFQDCVTCAEKIKLKNLEDESTDNKILTQKYQKCILSLQPSLKQKLSELLNKTTDVAIKINPIITTVILLSLIIRP